MSFLDDAGIDRLRAIAAEPSVIDGRFELGAPIGAGGMGVVYEAWDREEDRAVALKILREADAQGSARFAREAAALAAISHPGIVGYIAHGETELGERFIVMELLDGKDLGKVLRERGRLPLSLAVDYLLQAGEAIAAAHALGIVHRDLKPGNLFLAAGADGAPRIKVVDFGISKVTMGRDVSATEATITAPSTVIGTPPYMSPEQLAGGGHVDARTDLWALGAVLHELLTGRPPFDAPNPVSMGAKIAAGQPARLRDGCPEAPEGLAAVVLRCLEKAPDRRFQSMAELALALAPYAPPSSQISIDRIAGAERALAPTRATAARRRGARIAAGAILIAAGAAAIVLAARAPRAAEPKASEARVSPEAPASAAIAIAPSAFSAAPIASNTSIASSAPIVPIAAMASIAPGASGAPIAASVEARGSAPPPSPGKAEKPAATAARSVKAQATASASAAPPPRPAPPVADPLDPALLSR